MKTILHISADFPDPLIPSKTKAVANLLAATDGFRHVVYSLNRVSWQSGVCALPFGEDRLAIAYGAPPYGLGLEKYLRPVADLVTNAVEAGKLAPDLIHAHKFSVEGLVAAQVAERLNVPFIASVWGDTDSKIIEVKRGLRPRYRAIAAGAAQLLPATPWTARYVETTLGVARDRIEILPVITAADAVIRPRITGADTLISVFALDAWKRKGLDILAQAMGKVVAKRPNTVLDVFGAGHPKSLFAVTKLLKQLGCENYVRLRGPLAHDRIQQTMNGYAAYVMAPRRETYGMVHVEAVLAGLPVLWSREQGVDGLLGTDVGIRCNPESVPEVAEGIDFLLTHQRSLKDNIADMQSHGAFRHLQREGISRTYAAILGRITGHTPGDRVRPRLVASR